MTDNMEMTQEATPVPMNGASYPASTRPSLERLAVLDRPFAAWGTAEVKVLRNGKDCSLHVPIRSVPLEDVETMTKHLRPQIPTRREKIQGAWHTIVDEANPQYQEAVLAYQRTLSKVWVLLSLDLDVVDRHGTVVWSKDNSVHDIDGAVKALSEMGLVDTQLTTLFRAVQALTQLDEDVAQLD